MPKASFVTVPRLGIFAAASVLVFTLVARSQRSDVNSDSLEPEPIEDPTGAGEPLSATWQELAAAGVFAIKSGALDKAYNFQERALELVTPPRAGDIRPAQTLVLLSEIHNSAGKTALAEEALHAAVAAAEQGVGPNDPANLEILDSQANFYFYRDKFDKVLPIYQRILTICEIAPDQSSRNIANRARNLASLHERLRQFAEAEPLYRQALAAGEKAGPAFRPELIQDMLTVAAFYRSREQYNDAETLAQQALEMAERTMGPNSMDTAFALSELAEIYVAADESAEAEPLAARALSIAEKFTGPDSSDLAPRLVTLASALAAQQKYLEAQTQFERALAVTEKNLGLDSPETVALLQRFADLLDSMGQSADADARRRQADLITHPEVHEPTLAE